MTELNIVGTVTTDRDFTGPQGPAGPRGADGAPADPAAIDALGDAITGLRVTVARLDGQVAALGEHGGAIINLAASIAALTARVAALEGSTPPPPPLPDLDTVHVGAAMKVADTLLGWTSVQDQDHSATTAAILAKCGHASNTHWIGFGAPGPLQSGPGAPLDFTYLDSIIGGYFPKNHKIVLTLCGSPPYMRVPKPGAAPMPMGTPTMGLYDFAPPHWSWHAEWAQNAAAAVVHLKQKFDITVYAVHEWNEYKGESIGLTRPTGAVLTPPGSGLPIADGPAVNRWAMEMHTDRYNHVYTAIKAVSPNTKVMGPYMVTRTYTDPANPDAANDAFPMDLHGPWGYGDKKAMQAVMYWLEHAVGIDAICFDTKTSSNDKNILPEYEWDGLAKIKDWQNWIDDLVDFDSAKYGRAANAPLWFAEAYSRQIGGLTPATHQRAAAIDAWSYINHVLPNDVAGWMRWQPEGKRTATGDSADAHSISLWHAKGSAKSLQPTEAVPVYAGLVEHFPPGTQLYNVTVDDGAFPTNDFITGIASDTTICLVSRSANPQTLTFKGEPLVLAPYDVKFVPR